MACFVKVVVLVWLWVLLAVGKLMKVVGASSKEKWGAEIPVSEWDDLDTTNNLVFLNHNLLS
ncbi:uncharacterized protein G2W53_014740 [Senna tora]|uniref:Uncharacterized protein n=1 Tax=Senna tora TaxID=362788 RepID=A0A834WU75_9FABA|nr:uncharacterized protein G2W53_014740 [Senna tora]